MTGFSFYGCDFENGDSSKAEQSPTQQEVAVRDSCRASVIFEEIIIIKDTDPPQVNDQWTIRAEVIPGFPPNPNQRTTIVNNVVGDQGSHLLGPPPNAPTFTFGPKLLGLKDNRYDLKIVIEITEHDPNGRDDIQLLGPQLFEIDNMLCPNDREASYKFKETVVDPQNIAETGHIELRLRIDLDP